MKVHFIAIGGSIMHSLAIELKKNGHIVTGSDDVIYEPSKSNLKLHNLLPKKEGWSVSNISKDLDVVILENIDCFFTHAKDKKVVLMRDFNRSTKGFNSSIMRFNNKFMT